MSKMDLSQGCKDDSTCANQLVCQNSLTKWGIKNKESSQLIQKKKSIFQLFKFSIFIYHKNSQQSGIEGRYLNLIQAIYDSPTVNMILNSEKVKTFASRSVRRPESPLILNRRSQGLGGKKIFFFLLYNILLVLPYIDMNLPWVYTCSPS